MVTKQEVLKLIDDVEVEKIRWEKGETAYLTMIAIHHLLVVIKPLFENA
jgi:hypothetical protein